MPDMEDAAAPVDALDTGARVWAEIDLAALEHNHRAILGRLGQGVRVLAVLKADAYGHSAVICAKKLVELGVSMIGVGDSREALEVPTAGVVPLLLIAGAAVAGEMTTAV